ncbi:MAG: extracellular solute-binding protein [Candidatus Binataceae bacterium]
MPIGKLGRMRAAWRFALAFSLIAAGCRANRGSPHELTIALAVFPGEAGHYLAFARDFETSHRVRITLVAQSYGDILRVLRAEAGAGRGKLDIVELDLAMLAQARGSVRALDPIVGSQARALFPSAAWDAASSGGHIFFAPHRLMWQAMIYNRLEVPHPPATWQELERFAREHPGKLALKAARYEGAVCDVMPFVWGGGGDPLEPLASGSLRGLNYLRGLAPYLNRDSAVLREMSVLEAQARGEVWIHFNWPFAIAYLAGKGLAPGVDLSAPIPAGPDGSFTPLGGGYLAIPVSAPHPGIAAAFIGYLLTRRAQERLSRELGWYGSIEPEPASEQALLYSGFTMMRDRVRARPTIACYAQMSNRWQRAIREVLFRNVASGDALKPVAQAVNQAAGPGRCECR